MDKRSSKEEEQEAAKNLQSQTKNVSSKSFDANKISSPFTFNSEERLKSKKLIDNLFSEGSAIHTEGITLVYFYTSLDTVFPAQVGFSVPKKMFKRAVDRNIIKRRIREAYRLNKSDFYKKLQEKNVQLAFFFIYKGKSILEYNEIEIRVKTLMNKLS